MKPMLGLIGCPCRSWTTLSRQCSSLIFMIRLLQRQRAILDITTPSRWVKHLPQLREGVLNQGLSFE